MGYCSFLFDILAILTGPSRVHQVRSSPISTDLTSRRYFDAGLHAAAVIGDIYHNESVEERNIVRDENSFLGIIGTAVDIGQRRVYFSFSVPSMVTNPNVGPADLKKTKILFTQSQDDIQRLLHYIESL